MKLRTYQAYTMSEALDAVKRDLGADAVILHTRSFRRGGIFGFGSKHIVEVAATPADDVRPRHASTPSGDRNGERAGSINRTARSAAARGYRQTQAMEAKPDGAASGSSERSPDQPTQTAGATEHDRLRTQRLAMALQQQLERRRQAHTASASNAAVTAPAEPNAATPARVSPSTPPAGSASGPAATPPATPAPAAENQSPTAHSPSMAAPPVDRFHSAHRDADQGADGEDTREPAATATPDAATTPRPARRPAAVAQRFVLARTLPVDTQNGDDRNGVEIQTRPMTSARSSFTPAPMRSDDQTPAGAVKTGRQPSPSADPTDVVKQELATIRELVNDVLRRQSATSNTRRGGNNSHAAAVPSIPPKLFDLYLALVAQDLSHDLADEIINDVRDAIAPDARDDEAVLRDAVLQHLAARIPVATDAIASARPDDRPLTIALIGPTGVGKTTTVAKLAASLKLRHGRRVGLITSDTYRIAAVDQLRTYADIIDVPLKVVLTDDEMKTAASELQECDVVLIDTAGRGQHDAARLQELERMLKAARPHETHLVLSSTASEKVLRREYEAFARGGADKVILTKLDEAASFGALVTVMRDIDRPLSYVTTGQEVPDDIEPACARRLAALVLDGTFASAGATHDTEPAMSHTTV